jgi:hypothetical protein
LHGVFSLTSFCHFHRSCQPLHALGNSVRIGVGLVLRVPEHAPLSSEHFGSAARSDAELRAASSVYTTLS